MSAQLTNCTVEQGHQCLRDNKLGNTSPILAFTPAQWRTLICGALHLGFRRFADKLCKTARQVVGDDGGG